MVIDDALLDVSGLRVTFPFPGGDVDALRGIDFSVRRGEAVALVGESGSGKSLTALAILRLIGAPGRITAGRILLEGRDLLALSEREMRTVRGRDISIVFQDSLSSLNPAFTIYQQLADVIGAHQSLHGRSARSYAGEILEKVGIPAGRLDAYPFEFSGGMRQRALIAMAIACGPKLLIADEPTTALDVTVQAQIVDLLRSLQEELGLSLLFITHNLDLMGEICDKAVVLYGGAVMEKGLVETLCAAPRHPYTRQLLDCVPRLDALERLPRPIPGQPPTLETLGSGCPFAPRCSQATAQCVGTFPEKVEFDRQEVHCWAVG